jgi:hypothetical protein
MHVGSVPAHHLPVIEIQICQFLRLVHGEYDVEYETV